MRTHIERRHDALGRRQERQKLRLIVAFTAAVIFIGYWVILG